MDNLSSDARRRCMSHIRSSDTMPELRVRRYLHAAGVRFRLHKRDLPGCPDIVLSGSRQVVFVHGCFWHSHNCRWGRVEPKTHAEYWRAKRGGVVKRDKRAAVALEERGWTVHVIWECWTRDDVTLGEHLEKIVRKARQKLSSDHRTGTRAMVEGSERLATRQH